MRNTFYSVSLFVLFLATSAVAQESGRDKGIDLFRAGNYSAAAEVLSKEVEAGKGDKTTWLYLGASYMNLGKQNEARPAFLKYKDLKKSPVPHKAFERSVRILSKQNAPYTAKARSLGIEGQVLLLIEFRADGKIGFVFPLTELAGGLTESAIDAARKMRFEPAMLNGKPVTALQQASYVFNTF